jgi:hypothetical protein
LFFKAQIAFALAYFEARGEQPPIISARLPGWIRRDAEFLTRRFKYLRKFKKIQNFFSKPIDIHPPRIYLGKGI